MERQRSGFNNILKKHAFVAMALVFGVQLSAKSLDHVNWVDHPAWNCTTTISVRPFRLSGEFRGVKSQDDYMALFVEKLSKALTRPGGFEAVTLISRDETVRTDAVIVGEFVELSAGSRAARFWIGYGAGTAKTEVRLRGYRSDEQTEIFDLTHARISPFSLSGDANIGNIDAVVTDIAQELLKRRAPCNPAAVRSPTIDSRGESTDSPEESSKFAEVSIESNVPNADVLVDNQFVGNTPLAAFRLSPGIHILEISSKGFITWKRELTVTAQNPTRVVAKLEPED